MDSQLLKEFIVIADSGNFENAAQELFTTQSSLSKHIRKLESELQVVLFEKKGRNNCLTAAGKEFLPYARKILSVEEDARFALGKYQGHNSGSVSIASVPTLGAFHIPEILADFQQDYPNIQVQVSSTNAATMMQMLTDHDADLAFMRYAPWDDISMFNVIPFTSDELCIICPAGHPLEKRDSVNLASLCDENFIGYSPHSFMNRYSTECCLDAGFSPNVTLVAQGIENIVELVASGLGICLAMTKPVSYIDGDDDRIRILHIDPPYTCRVDLCYLKTRKLSDSAIKFIDEVRKWLASHPS